MQYSGSGYHQQAPPDQAYGGYGYNSRAPAYYSIDVECVAIGTTHRTRAVAQIALVVRTLSQWSAQLVSPASPLAVTSGCPVRLQDEFETVLLNIYVKPDQPVTSYLTPLTG